jgi:uridine kinase
MYLIGIAGGSGSGKTTFAQKVIRSASSPDVILLHQDSYYLPKIPDTARGGGKINFDHPEAFDWELLKNHLERLRRGEQIAVPMYDFKTNSRLPDTQLMGPSRVIVLEGIFALWDEQIRKLLDLKIYLNVEADIRFIRRLHRDVHERARTLDSIIRQYYDSVRPMHHEFLEPTRQYADLIVGEETDLAAEVVAAQVFRLVQQSREAEL